MIMKHLFIVAISVFFSVALDILIQNPKFTEYSGIVLNFFIESDGIMARKLNRYHIPISIFYIVYIFLFVNKIGF